MKKASTSINGELSQTRQAEEWVTYFNPNAEPFLDLLLPLIDNQMLRQIAEADYGMDAEQHLVPLVQWRDHRIIPILRWHPCEVLELIRWSQPENPDWKPGATGEKGHLMRAFSCATLLRAYAHPENKDNWLSLNETAVQLVDSIHALGKDYVHSGAQFFAWCFQTLSPLPEDAMEAAFFGLATLSLVASDKTYPDEAVIALCKWIEMSVCLQLDEPQRAQADGHWLLFLNHHNLRNEAWRNLGSTLHHWAVKQSVSDRATWVALIGKSLNGGNA